MTVMIDGYGSILVLVLVVVAARLLYDVARVAGLAAVVALWRKRPRPDDTGLSIAERIHAARKAVK